MNNKTNDSLDTTMLQIWLKRHWSIDHIIVVTIESIKIYPIFNTNVHTGEYVYLIMFIEKYFMEAPDYEMEIFLSNFKKDNF